MTFDDVRSTYQASNLRARLDEHGLAWLGTLVPEDQERLFPDRAAQPHAVAIIGNVGSRIWPFFDAARQERPELTLDRWTEEVVGKIASEAGLEVVYPFKGPPYHPFIAWAKRSGSLFSSPIGLTIHPQYGLWIAFRAALLLDQPLDQNTPEGQPVPARHPCESCEDKPCLSTCPVGAFTGDGYDFEACLDQVATPVNACREGGCLARIACPIGRAYRYEPAHAAFHMGELLKAHGRAAAKG